MKKITVERKLRRKRRVSNNIMGTSTRPRISVFRSNRYIYAQAIDDIKRVTLATYSTLQLTKMKDYKKVKKTAEAKAIGLALAKILKSKKIEESVFDRNIYSYLGRVKAIAEGLREGGIKI